MLTCSQTPPVFLSPFYIYPDPSFLCLHLLPTRMVNNSQTESSPTSTGEASALASSSTGSSHLADARLDLSGDRREEAELPQASQSQLGEEDKDTLDTKKDEQLGWRDCGAAAAAARNREPEVAPSRPSRKPCTLGKDPNRDGWREVTFDELTHH